MTQRTWRTSSYSSTGAECVELSVSTDDTAVRDSKNRSGGELGFSATAWRSFVAVLTQGRLGGS